MANYQHEARFQGGNLKINTSLQLFSFKDDSSVVVYSPALDLCGYGKDEQEAKLSFNVVLEEFIKYTTNKNTLITELEKLGWLIKGSKKNPKLSAPDITSMLVTNEELARIFNKKEFKKFEQKMAIAQVA